MKPEDCVHHMPIVGGDEVIDYCSLIDKPCLLLSNAECDLYEEVE